MEMKKLVQGLVIAGAMVAGGSAIAATQGSTGGTSTGDILIDVTVGNQILINNLADIIGTHVPFTPFIGSSPACVYTNNPSGNYEVTITSSNPGAANEFRLNDGGGTLVVYTLSYNDGDSSAPMLSGVVNSTFDNADTTDPSCATPQSSIDINIPAANLDAVGPGSYSDTVTILVAPR